MTSTWRTNETIKESFSIFDDSYWNGKEQLKPGISDQLSASIDDLRDYINYPIRLLDSTFTTVVNTFLLSFVRLHKVDCSDNNIEIPTTQLIDPNLLWSKESFQSDILEGMSVRSRRARRRRAAAKAAAEKARVMQNNPPPKPLFKDIGGSKFQFKRKSKEGFISGTKVDKQNQISVEDLQELIARYQNNHSFMKDTDIHYSTRNKVATYYIQRLNEYETIQKSRFDASGLFEFNNWFDNQLAKPNIQSTIQKIHININDNRYILYDKSYSIVNTVNAIYADINSSSITTSNKTEITNYYNANPKKFENALAIYCIQQKTKYEYNRKNNDTEDYKFFYDISYNKTLSESVELSGNTIFNIAKHFRTSFDSSTFLKEIKTIHPNPQFITTFTLTSTRAEPKLGKCDRRNWTNLSDCEKQKCIVDASNNIIKKDIKKITETVKKELYNIIFIPMILVIIYNFYYFLFYKDCYKKMIINEKSVCIDYNEFPKLEQWIKHDIFNIKLTDSPNFLIDFLLDLVFKPVTFMYTCFNSIKPFCMKYNKEIPHICFTLLAMIIMPLFMSFRKEIFEILGKILLFQTPDSKYLIYSQIIIWGWFGLVALQRIAGIGLYQETDEKGENIPRSWWEWIKSKGANPFIAISCIIFTLLYWLMKGLATYAIIPLSIWSIFFYIFAIGIFGIWNNSSDGYNPKFETDRSKSTDENPYKTANDIWKDIDDSIYKKLFKKMEGENTLFDNIKHSGRTILQFIFVFMAEFIAIIILFSALIKYSLDSNIRKFHYIRNFLFISTGILISFIIGWCGLKYVTRIRKIWNEYLQKSDTPDTNTYDIPEDRTFANIWKDIFEIGSGNNKSFVKSLDESFSSLKNAPGNLGSYIKERTNAGIESVKSMKNTINSNSAPSASPPTI